MDPLIGVEADPVFALGVVDEPVEHGLGYAQPSDAGDQRDGPSVDEGSGWSASKTSGGSARCRGAVPGSSGASPSPWPPTGTRSRPGRGRRSLEEESLHVARRASRKADSMTRAVTIPPQGETIYLLPERFAALFFRTNLLRHLRARSRPDGSAAGRPRCRCRRPVGTRRRPGPRTVPRRDPGSWPAGSPAPPAPGAGSAPDYRPPAPWNRYVRSAGRARPVGR